MHPRWRLKPRRPIRRSGPSRPAGVSAPRTSSRCSKKPLALPDIEVEVAKNGKEKQVRVTLNGVALFDRKPRTTEYKAALRAEVDPEEFTLKLDSEPFPVRGYKRVAVKVVDVYGNESTAVRELAA